MRTTLGLLATVLAVAACDDHQQPTSPAPAATNPSPVASVAPGSPTVNAKPTDQVGFTKVQYFETGWNLVPAGDKGDQTLTCPAGTFVVGGGHNIWGGGAGMPLIRISGVNGNGWRVVVENLAAGAVQLSYKVSVNCVG